MNPENHLPKSLDRWQQPSVVTRKHATQVAKEEDAASDPRTPHRSRHSTTVFSRLSIGGSTILRRRMGVIFTSESRGKQ